MFARRFWSPMMMMMVLLLAAGGGALTSSCRRAAPEGATPAPTAVPVPAAPTAPPVPAPAGAAGGTAGAPFSPRVSVQVTEEGFVPSEIPAVVGKPITLVITRRTDKTCAREILFKGQPGKTDLPLDKEVEVSYTPKVSGAVPFGCAMGMMIGGTLQVR